MKLITCIKQKLCFHNWWLIADWIDFGKDAVATKLYECKKCGKQKTEVKTIGKVDNK